MSLDLSSTILDLIKSVNDVTETFVSRNGSSMYGSLSPYNNKGASLGTSSKQWNTIYGGTIYENGTSLSNKYGVTVTQKLTSGTEIGSIKVGSTTTKLYAPTGSGSVSGNYLPLSGGTMKGNILFDINVNDSYTIGDEELSYIRFSGGYGDLSLSARGTFSVNGGRYNSLSIDDLGITLSAKSGEISATAPTNVSGQEKVTAWFNTANGGRVGFGKEATNSGTGIFFDQVKGTRRLNFRASSTAGAMVWEQPEANSGLYFDVNNVFFRGANNVQFTKLQSAGYLYTDSSGYLKKGTMPTSLKNPKALKFGSKTYDGSTAQTITASDIGANVTVTQKLTSGTEIGSVTVGSTTTKLYAPEGSTGSNDEFVHIKVSSVNNYGASWKKYIYVQVISGELRQGDLIQVCHPKLTSKHNRVNGIKTNERKVNRMKAFKTYTVRDIPDCVNAGVSMYKIEIDTVGGSNKEGRGIFSSFTPDGKQRKPRTVRVMRPYVDDKGFTRNKQISNSVNIATSSMTDFISVM